MKPYHKTFKELLQSDYEDEGFRALKEAVLERIDIYDDVRESQELRDLEQECNG